jgi:hypothetical protein
MSSGRARGAAVQGTASVTRARTLLARLLSLVLLLAAIGPEGHRLPLGQEPALVGLSAPDAVLAPPERAASMRATGDARDDGQDAGVPPAALSALVAGRAPASPAPGPESIGPERPTAAYPRGPPDHAA